MPEKNKKRPVCIFDAENNVIPWEIATKEQRQEYFIAYGLIEFQKQSPDTGHGKNNRKKCRGGQKSY